MSPNALQPTCRGCGAAVIERALDLGDQPAADLFPPAGTPGEDPRWPLQLWFCKACLLIQLGPVEPLLPEEPLAVESETSRRHAAWSVERLMADHPELRGGTVAEYASHHGGSWLGHLSASGCRVVAEGEQAGLVVDVHGLTHEPDIRDALAERVARMTPGGLLVLEFHHVLPLLEQTQFDTVRHGHWSYLSVTALSRVAAPMGVEVVGVREIDQFGGSVRVAMRHRDAPGSPDASVRRVLDAEAAGGVTDPARVAGLRAAADRAAAALRELLTEYRAAGRTVLGYGAPSKAPVLLNVSGIGPELLPFTVDAAPGKHGRRIPGCGVPIRPVDELRAARPDVVLLLTWDIADEVIGQLEADGGWGADYLLPLPEPHLARIPHRVAGGSPQ